MSEVKFLADAHVHDEHGVIIESFKAGQTIDFKRRPGSAERWIKRGVAISVEDIAAEAKARDDTNAADSSAGAKAGADGSSGNNAVDDGGASASSAAGGKPKR